MPVSEHGAVAPKFTKGPWEAAQNRHLQLFVCCAENHDEEICEVTSGRDFDAKAIAALPDLIEALTVSLQNLHEAGNLFEDGKNGEAWEWIMAACTMGKHALAKARGEA